MKNLRRFTFLLLTGLVLLSGCDLVGDDDEAGNGTMTAKIDGQSWSAANATANKISAMGQTIITISGAKTSGENMVITLNNINAAGDYDIGGGGKAGASFSPAGEVGPGSYSAQSGSLTLTRLDDSGAEGTFSFNGKLPDGSKSTSVTDGKFKVAFGPALGG